MYFNNHSFNPSLKIGPKCRSELNRAPNCRSAVTRRREPRSTAFVAKVGLRSEVSKIWCETLKQTVGYQFFCPKHESFSLVQKCDQNSWLISLSWVKLWVLWRPRVVSSYLLASGHPPYKSNNLHCDVWRWWQTLKPAEFLAGLVICVHKKKPRNWKSMPCQCWDHTQLPGSDRSSKADIASPSGISLKMFHLLWHHVTVQWPKPFKANRSVMRL